MLPLHWDKGKLLELGNFQIDSNILIHLAQLRRERLFMKKIAFLCIGTMLVFSLVFAACVGKEVKKQNSLTSLQSGETGKIYFKSRSPYGYHDILDGLENDSELMVYGVLTIPEGTQGKIPAVVHVHGSGGWSKKHKPWLKTLNKMGVATFRIDCFRPRRVSSTVGTQVEVTSAMMIADAFYALKLLSTHPRIDKDRIGIIGGSKGGIVALNTAWEPLRKSIIDDDLKFAFHIPIYPLCMQFEKVEMTGAPILILIGEKDNWTPTEYCIEVVDQLLEAQYDTRIIIYPNAYHSFDADYRVRIISEAFKISTCHFKILADGRTIETNSGLSANTEEEIKNTLATCAKRGPYAGENAKAKKKSLEDMKAFVSEVCGL